METLPKLKLPINMEYTHNKWQWRDTVTIPTIIWLLISKHPLSSCLNKTWSLRRGCLYWNSFPVVFSLNRENLSYSHVLIFEKSPRLLIWITILIIVFFPSSFVLRHCSMSCVIFFKKIKSKKLITPYRFYYT